MNALKTLSFTLAALCVASAAFADNLVPEAKRAFDVPFKGEGKMSLVYVPAFFPKNTRGAVISGEVKYEGVERGAQKWFDARVMTDFIDSQCKKVKSGPVVGGGWAGTSDGWVAFKKTVEVPDGAAGVALMPCLFNVKSGALSVRNLSVEPQEKFTEDPAEAARREADAAKKSAADAAKADRARALLDREGSLIPAPADGVYAHLVSTEPGKLVSQYKVYDLPRGVEAMRLSWSWRVQRLAVGEKPWFDARVLLKFLGADGKELNQGAPSPTYVQRDTKGWEERANAFLVPAGAAQIVVMPCLFQVKAGELEMKDVKLSATDAVPLRAARAEAERQRLARAVPDEAPVRARWPKPLHVSGNRIVDPDGRDVWLQGVNAGGMESVPNSDQVIKSAVVAVDDWKSNCVRLPVKEEFWFGTSAYQNDGGAAYRAAVDKIVMLVANRGAYVVLDLHRFRAPKEEHAAFWKDAAARYANHPAVLFDLFNEPHGIDWKTWRDGGFVGEAGAIDESAFLSADEKAKNKMFKSIGMQALVDAVRGAGAKNIVIAGGLAWANDLTGIANDTGAPTWDLDDRGGNGVVYSWHTYHWHKGWSRLLPVLARHPVFLGEVGACPLGIMNFIPDEQQEDPYTFAPDMLGFIQKEHIHWTGWCLHPKAAPCLIVNWDYEPTPYWGAFVKRALSGERFGMKRMR